MRPTASSACWSGWGSLQVGRCIDRRAWTTTDALKDHRCLLATGCPFLMHAARLLLMLLLNDPRGGVMKTETAVSLAPCGALGTP